MTHNISRRTLAKGAAWAAPAVVATTAIPAYAASPDVCSTANLAVIDAAFADFQTRNLAMELNIFQPLAAFNGTATDVYVNFKNIGDTDVTYTALNPLIINLDLVQTTPQERKRNMTRATTSWGEVLDLGYNAATKTHSYQWVFIGTIPANAGGNSEADMVFGVGDGLVAFQGRINSKMMITPVELKAPAPLLSSIVPDEAQQQACLSYYNQKVEELNSLVQTQYTYAGPAGGGDLAVNTTIDSTTFGNYSPWGSQSVDGIW